MKTGDCTLPNGNNARTDWGGSYGRKKMFDNIPVRLLWWLFWGYIGLAFVSVLEWTKAKINHDWPIREKPLVVTTVAFLQFLLYPFTLFLIYRKGANYLREATPIFGWFWHRSQESSLRLKIRKIKERDHRARALKEKIDIWRSYNLPIVYYNTIAGVTAAVRKEDYDQMVVPTASAVIDKSWPISRGGVLLPAQKTFIFVEEGCRRSDIPERYIAGRKSDLFIRMSGRIRLVRLSNVFVPFVSEKPMSTDEQVKWIQSATPFSPSPGLSISYVRSHAWQQAEQHLCKPLDPPADLLKEWES